MSAEVLEQLKTLGERFASARRRRGRSQFNVAYSAGLTRLMVSRIENGATGIALAHYLAVLNELNMRTMITEFVAPERDSFGETFARLFSKRPYHRSGDRL